MTVDMRYDPTRGHWCDFCQTFHSSQSCYHPGGRMLTEAQNRIASLESALERYRQKNSELLERIEQLSEDMELMVEKGWAGLLTILDEVYPASIFGGKDDDWEAATRDLGPRFTTLAHHLAAEKQRADEAEATIEAIWVAHSKYHLSCEDCSDAVAKKEAQIASLIADWNIEHPRRLDAESEVERLKWMLDACYADWVDGESKEAWLADLAARYEKEHT